MQIHQLAEIIPLMTEEEYQDLKQDIQENGLLEPIITYEGKILDGRNRFKACQELNIEPRYEEYTRNSPVSHVISFNIKRRHLTPSQLACVAVDKLPYLREEAKKRMLAAQNNKAGQEIAATQKIGDQEKGEAIEKAAKKVQGTNAEYIRQAEKIKEENPEIFKEIKEGKKTISEAIKEEKREKIKERLDEIRAKGVMLPEGKYSCLIIDPPWPMKKIEREVSPNQIEFDYPTMNESQLKDFGMEINTLADKNCHLYLWTTQKFLPMALRLVEYWGFQYHCLMTWVKNVGFTPFSWMYSTEHVLYCTKGNLPLLKQGLRLDFKADVREHSRKPDEFYEIVKIASPSPRIDIFSTEKREGFDQYGNEVNKYRNKSETV